MTTLGEGLVLQADGPVQPLYGVMADAAAAWVKDQPPAVAAWMGVHRFRGEAGRLLVWPDAEGRVAGAVLGLGNDADALAFARAAADLPAGTWRLVSAPASQTPVRVALAWALGRYRFDRYKGSPAEGPAARLLVESPAVRAEALRLAEGVALARDLVNVPASDMGPAELEAAVRSVAGTHGAAVRVVTGEDLLAAGYPMIHAVGRASARAPRLIDLTWGDPAHPKVTLVGKGVCFDSGGLDLKPSSAMLLMKKDMGGAAAMLGLAQMTMAAARAVRLRLLIPAVENSVSGASYRPGDVLTSRKGLTVEIGNTDAEGRLVLADALAEADAERPALIIEMATLTGAARTATGFELPPFFTPDEALAADLQRLSVSEADPMWRLPLWPGYESWIEGKVADLTNSPDGATAGAITAALFLKRFVTETPAFVHFDVAAWTDRAKPGRPVGGEAHAIRALDRLLAERFGPKTT